MSVFEDRIRRLMAQFATSPPLTAGIRSQSPDNRLSQQKSVQLRQNLLQHQGKPLGFYKKPLSLGALRRWGGRTLYLGVLGVAVEKNRFAWEAVSLRRWWGKTICLGALRCWWGKTIYLGTRRCRKLLSLG